MTRKQAQDLARGFRAQAEACRHMGRAVERNAKGQALMNYGSANAFELAAKAIETTVGLPTPRGRKR